MKTIYGPVASWRLGRSLGIDPICREKKVCSFDCIYCQLGSEKKINKRKKIVDIQKLKRDLCQIQIPEADVITLSGTGEPTLASNLGEIIDYLEKSFDLPIAILTNSSLLSDEKVRAELYGLDIVVAKLDAPNQEIFERINRPHRRINFEKTLDGINTFRENYKGKFSLQIMFIDENKGYVEEMVRLAEKIDPDEIQINTPLRPSPIEPLSRKEIEKIKNAFGNLKNVISVYEAERPKVFPIDLEEIHKRKRPKP